MKARVYTVHQLLEQQLHLYAPTHQRRYVWSEDADWRPFWDDVARVVDDLMADPSSASEPHFFGSVILSHPTRDDADVTSHEIIDGQQRLVTLSLLIDAVAAVAEDEGRAIDRHTLEALLYNQHFENDTTRFKVWPTTGDQNAYRATLARRPRAAPGPVSGRIPPAWHYLYESIQRWLRESQHDAEVATLVAKLKDAICDRFHFVVIELDEVDNQYRIFETMNDLGEPLYRFDLARNHFLRRAAEDGLDEDTLYVQYIQWFDDNDWWLEQSGFESLVWADLFLFHWLQLKLLRSYEVKQTHRAFVNYALSDDFVVDAVMKDFLKHGKIFLSMYHKKGALRTEFASLFDMLEVTSKYVLTPPLLWLFATRAELDDNELRRTTRMLESILIRRTIGCASNSDVVLRRDNSIRLVRAWVEDDAFGPSDALVVWLLRNEPNFPLLRDEPLANWLKCSLVQPRVLTQDVVRLLLVTVEDHWPDGNETGREPCPDGLKLERLMPTEWQADEWPRTENTDAPWWQAQRSVDAARDILTGSLGNLTLSPKNATLTSGPWSARASDLTTARENAMDRAWVDEGSFDGNDIIARGEQMAKIICAVWPHPEDIQSSR